MNLLGKAVDYNNAYSPALLFPIAREQGRALIGIQESLPFFGEDYWRAFELSWLNPQGKPIVCMASFCFPCTTPFLIESKSLKLYLNSFNQHVFYSQENVKKTLERDLYQASGGMVSVDFISLDAPVILEPIAGILLDDLEITTSVYTVQPDFLTTLNGQVSETLSSHLLKSNCPVTGQPDWASVTIQYTGPKINSEGLLKYIISFRHHDEFHEQCVERMFMDIMQRCRPSVLSVYARYTRRGGLDINPFRSSVDTRRVHQRLVRQ